MSKFVSAYSEKQSFVCPSGTQEVPVFSVDENNDVVPSGKTNLFAEIQSHLSEVVLDKLIARCELAGTSLEAPDEMFGDSTILPSDLLDAKSQINSVNAFKSSLSSDDLSLLLEKGFDEYVKIKLAAAVSSSDTVSEVISNE